jgi:hypothetical protein
VVKLKADEATEAPVAETESTTAAEVMKIIIQ